jgi:multiple sugar transport system permease protein
LGLLCRFCGLNEYGNGKIWRFLMGSDISPSQAINRVRPDKAALRNRRLMTAGTYLMAIVLTGLTILPFLWMISTSFKNHEEAVAYPPALLPKQPTLENYRYYTEIIYQTGEQRKDSAGGTVPIGTLSTFPPEERGGFPTWYFNTIMITAASLIGAVFVSAMAGYAFAKMDFTGNNILLIMLLSGLMIPWMVILIPQYILFVNLGWVGTPLPLFVPELIGGWPLGIFLFRQHFKTIPRELSEAAIVDGATHLGIFWRIMLPLSKPVMATVTVFILLAKWNSLIHPLVYLSKPTQWTLSLALFNLSRFFGDESAGSVFIRHKMAGAVLVVVPVVILFFFAQRYFIAGLTQGAVKQ